jgi:DNA-binding response OmpR family regulator
MMMDQRERAAALIVEDDPWIRALIADVLRQSGYTVQEASNGCAALRLAEREPPTLVLLDLVLPERSGLSVLAELKAAPATAHVPVVVVSGQSDLLACAVGRADAVITKPFDVDELLAEIKLLAGGRWQADPDCERAPVRQREPSGAHYRRPLRTGGPV